MKKIEGSLLRHVIVDAKTPVAVSSPSTGASPSTSTSGRDNSVLLVGLDQAGKLLNLSGRGHAGKLVGQLREAAEERVLAFLGAHLADDLLQKSNGGG